MAAAGTLQLGTGVANPADCDDVIGTPYLGIGLIAGWGGCFTGVPAGGVSVKIGNGTYR